LLRRGSGRTFPSSSLGGWFLRLVLIFGHGSCWNWEWVCEFEDVNLGIKLGIDEIDGIWVEFVGKKLVGLVGDNDL
jgi:hypothetical protein